MPTASNSIMKQGETSFNDFQDTMLESNYDFKSSQQPTQTNHNQTLMSQSIVTPSNNQSSIDVSVDYIPKFKISNLRIANQQLANKFNPQFYPQLIDHQRKGSNKPKELNELQKLIKLPNK